jgi:hypothetical protein
MCRYCKSDDAEIQTLENAMDIVKGYAKDDNDQELQECVNALEVLIGDIRDAKTLAPAREGGR